ncbi:hypothetical protein DID88_000530 [Monilinia fructigena]|uniref:Uncharacterized protein n=1 Tax=Monilinia fructigena TaxID=38457 RepID=A0A395IKK5_9HELO|nr:hypothetical protein DID88_000530 [Monilinia fructigena]
MLGHESTKDLRSKSTRAKWNGLFKRLSNPILKPLPPPSPPSPPPSPPPPPPPPNFLLTRRTHFPDPNIPDLRRSIVSETRFAASSTKLSAYPYINRHVNPNMPTVKPTKYKTALDVRKNTYADQQKRSAAFAMLRERHTFEAGTTKMVARKRVGGKSRLVGASVADFEGAWNLDSMVRVG